MVYGQSAGPSSDTLIHTLSGPPVQLRPRLHYVYEDVIWVNIESLLALGFTYEELYNKGLLVAAPDQDPAPADPAPADPAPADPAPADPAPADPAPADSAPETNETIEALRTELAELKAAIQNLNIKNAERTGASAQSEQISVEDAIIGLVKEM